MKNEVKDVEPPREVKPRQIQQRKTSLTGSHLNQSVRLVPRRYGIDNLAFILLVGVLSLAASGNSSKLEELLQSFPEMAISRDGVRRYDFQTVF
jgi:hypothetical protein